MILLRYLITMNVLKTAVLLSCNIRAGPEPAQLNSFALLKCANIMERQSAQLNRNEQSRQRQAIKQKMTEFGKRSCNASVDHFLANQN